jgi:glucose/arabinose dehydrogenase
MCKFKIQNIVMKSKMLIFILIVSGITAFAQNNAGLKLPTGFTATLFADNIGMARHIAVTSKGVVFAKLMAPNKEGKGIVRLEDKNKDGVADVITGWGDYGGTGMYIKGNDLYASSDVAVFKYQLNNQDEVVNPTSPKTIVKDLIAKNQHASKSITIDGNGKMYVNIGAYSNACQENDRMKGSKGMMPCPILDNAGGIWQFDVNKENQSYAQGKRYATGLRNVVGLDWNTQTNSLFVMQHGRDQLNSFYPEFYSDSANAELPAETMYELHEGDNCGWPYAYFDPYQKKRMLSPEYGGNGKLEGPKDAIDPIAYFPAHMAPNALLFYTGNQFPEKYKNGAFIAFHGSWNRAPLPQEGYYVVFVPFKNGKPSGPWEVFADGFSGTDKVLSTRKAKARPCGLAQGPDGSLYVSDDVKGAIFKINYRP